jgi:hypothetical protein
MIRLIKVDKTLMNKVCHSVGQRVHERLLEPNQQGILNIWL